MTKTSDSNANEPKRDMLFNADMLFRVLGDLRDDIGEALYDEAHDLTEGLVKSLSRGRHLVLKMQHCGPHEQDRHDARQWMDEHADGRCRCRKCELDEKRFQERAKKNASRSEGTP